MRDNKFIGILNDELKRITPDDLIRLQKMLGFTQRDICEALDIHYSTYQKYYVTRTAELPNTHRLFIFYSLILWEKPLNYLGIHRGPRSYWMAWRDLGVPIPDDIQDSYTYPLTNDLILIKQYRKGIKDALAEKEKKE